MNKTKWYLDSTGLKVDTNQSSYKKCFEIKNSDFLDKTKEGLLFYTLRKNWVDKESYIESYTKLAKAQGIESIKATFNVSGVKTSLGLNLKEGNCKKELLDTNIYKFPLVGVEVKVS